MKILTYAACILAMIFVANQTMAFCGFYVAKTDAKLFNDASQVIIVRKGNRTVITMKNDYKGDVDDFAMVVPVPEVLKEQNIRITKKDIFEKLDSYSAPRLVEYYDQDPCPQPVTGQNFHYLTDANLNTVNFSSFGVAGAPLNFNVTVEAKYQVGEYDILILSAKESTGLKGWLLHNGYKIPASAEEVLEPYIKSNMKFFVVKVNKAALDKNNKGFQELNPIQIAFQSDKFMLPIRLGMANSKGTQDMIVYALTEAGRVEVANYRTVNLPTDANIPEFMKPKFSNFYKDVFQTAYNEGAKNTVFLEYAWDMNSNNFVKCDPCVGAVPDYVTLREAGVYWVTGQGNFTGSQYIGNLHITRLHVRYDRKNFPQDLMLSVTPNKQNFQGRYVMQHAVTHELQCDAANDYFKKVADRREQELKTLASLTGWDVREYQSYVEAFRKKVQKGWIENDFDNGSTLLTPISKDTNPPSGPHPLSWLLLSGALLFGINYWITKASQRSNPLAA